MRPLRIRRDNWGIPHVDAENVFDAWFGLGFNWDVELARLRILLEDGPGAVLALNPECSPPDLTDVRSAFPGLDHLRTDLEALAGLAGGGASNNWALHGSRTRSGRPLL